MERIKNKKYIIVSSDSPDNLGKTVTYWLSLGFVCVGGVAFNPLPNADATGKVWLQAMVHEGEEREWI